MSNEIIQIQAAQIQHLTLLINQAELQLKEAVAHLVECADDLASELDDRYKIEPGGTIHPAMQRKYERDMAPVITARRFIDSLKEENNVQ